VSKLGCLIVDDERLAREKLRRQLEADPDVEVLGEARDATLALALARSHPPDVVFLDISMPGRSGLELAPDLGGAAIVFVTAHEQHAVAAFETGAVDYLLKPFEQARLAKTLARVRREVKPVRRLLVRDGRAVRFVRVDELAWIEAADNYVALHLKTGEEHLLRETLTRLEGRLPEGFVRVHRRAIVNREEVEEVRGEELSLRGGTKVPVGRTYRGALTKG
jgi:two-component system, LytTR family, response regulator